MQNGRRRSSASRSADWGDMVLYLYNRGYGSSEIQFLRKMPDSEWQRRKATVCRLLRAGRKEQAAALLESIPFEYWEATNRNGDEFWVLHYRASVDDYSALDQSSPLYDESTWRHVARALAEAVHETRFIVATIDDQATSLVPMPALDFSSDAVERALADAEQLVQSRGALSGVDRFHTVFHGYLRNACASAGIDVPDDASATVLFKELRQHHPRLRAIGPRAPEIDRIGRSMAAIADALNPVRNKSSLAHPNTELLEEPEAFLAINAVRTLLRYLDRRLRS